MRQLRTNTAGTTLGKLLGPFNKSSSTTARKRIGGVKLETLEKRLLLSISDQSAVAANATSVLAPNDPRNPLTPDPATILANNANSSSVLSALNGEPNHAIGTAPSTTSDSQPGTVTLYAHPGAILVDKIGAVKGDWSGLTSPGQWSGQMPSGKATSPASGGTGPGGYIAPAQIAGAYGLDQVKFGAIQGDGAGQTIAVIDNGDNPGFLNSSDPNFANSALGVFDSYYGIPNLPTFSFQKYDQNGSPISGGPDNGWGLEIALDVEWAHALAPAAKIALVEGNSASFADLGAAQVSAAAVIHAGEISMSYGGFLEYYGDGSSEPFYDSNYLAPGLAAQPNTVYLASTGDSGAYYGPNYPSISPLVAGVGGTNLDVAGNSYLDESAWSDGGGGTSSVYGAPSYQSGVTGYGSRTNPDISSAAVGASVYDPWDYGGWVGADGTSWSSPMWAAFTAVANQGRVLAGGQGFDGSTQQFQSALYSAYTSANYGNYFNDITTGGNGYSATTGYDLATGIGTPKLQNLIPYLAQYQVGPGVVSESPALSSVVTGVAPTQFSVTYSLPIDPTTIHASDFTINGVAASSASLSADGLTITYLYPASPVTTEGVQHENLPAGAMTGLDGLSAGGISGTFDYVKVQLKVQTTSPTPGSVLVAPVTDLVVQFNKPFDPATISSGIFHITQGTVVAATIETTSSVDLTLSGVTQDGTLGLTIAAGAIHDLVGIGNLAYAANYVVQVNSQPYPTPLTGKAPAGSLIYDPTVTGAINFVGDSDSYTLSLAAGQRLSALLTTDAGLTGTVSVSGPGGPLGSATAAGPGDNVILESVPVATAGTYTITVSGSGSGNYTLQAVLNAYLKQATDADNSLAAAIDLSSSFASLGTTPSSDRAGVIGTTNSTGSADFYKFYLNAGQSTTLAAQGLSGPVSLGLFDGSGNLLATPSAASSQGAINLGSGFSSAAGLLTVNGNAQLNGSNLQLTDGGFSEAGSAFNANAAYIGNFSTSFNFQLTPGTNPTADGITFTIQGAGANAIGAGGGGLGYAGLTPSVAVKFDLYNNAGEGIDSTGLYTDGQYPDVPAIDLTGTGVDLHSGDVFNVTMNYDGATLNVTITDTVTNASASQSYSVNIPAIIGGYGAYVGFTGGTGGLTSVQDIQNWTFTPAQTFISTGKFESINNFVAPTAGWYYAQVGGAPGTNYTLVATRGADFTLHGDSFAHAQNLDGVSVVLGAITPPSGLQALDLQAFNYSKIYQTDATTGAFGSSIVSPTSDGYYLFGQNMANDGTYTYYNDGYGDNNAIYKLDSTGAVVASGNPLPNYGFTGLAYLGGQLYGADVYGDVYKIDPNTFAVTGFFYQPGVYPLTGLTGDPDNGMLYAVSQFHQLYEIDPSSGAILASAPDNSQGFNEQDIAYLNGKLIVSDSNGAYGAGNNVLDEYDANTLGFVQRVNPPYTYEASGLAAGSGQQSDWYQFAVNAGDNLVLTTTTPGGPPGEFGNFLNPTINLYDASDNLVATATGNAADGRNDVIDWTALSSGEYRVQVLGAEQTSIGEYTVAIQGATGGTGPFSVTSTNPAANALVGSQVSTMDVHFSDNVLLSSLSDSDFTIDGNAATAFIVNSGNDVTFAFAATTNGVHSVSIDGVVDVHGTALTPDNFTFATDDVAPYVVSSSIAGGAVFSPGDITEVVTFSKSINPASANAGDLALYGFSRSASYAPASFSFDPTDTILTVNYTNISTDLYQFALLAGPSNFTSDAGVPLGSSFSVDFSVPWGTNPFPVPLKPISPLGGLAYQGSVDNVLSSAAQVDTYTLPLLGNQLLDLVVTPESGALQPIVTLLDPNGIPIASTTSAGIGQAVELNPQWLATTGTYSFTVSDANGNTGEYKIQALLNAATDPGGQGNSSTGTALPIDGYATPTPFGSQRISVLGTIGSGQSTNVYSVTLTPGESASFVTSDLQGTDLSMSLEDSAQNVLANGATGATNYAQGISDFVSSAGGTYYVVITGGTSGDQFNLVVTENAGFDTGNSTQVNPQPLPPSGTVLGDAGLVPVSGPAAKVLYYNDFEIATNTFGQALAALGITPTVASSYAEFESDLASGTWSLVILMNQGSGDTTWETPLINYVQGGGHVIVASWTQPQNVAAAFGAFYTGNNDQSPITQTAASPIWNGISNPFYLYSPGWGIWSTGLVATTGQSIGTFPNGDSGIVVGNSGNTVLNGFLGDTPADASQGLLLAENEITSLLAPVNKVDYYSFQANANDKLAVNLSLPGDPTGQFQFPNLLNAKFEILDPNGNVVGSSTGAGTMNLTAQLSGTYEVEVGSADGTSAGEYVLNVTGNTAGISPFLVTSSTPANGALVQPPSSYTVTFNNSVLLTSLAADEFTITTSTGSETASSYVVDSPNTVTFYFDSSIYPFENRGNAQITISGDGTNFPADLSGATLGGGLGYVGSFTFDNVAPTIVSSSIDGQTFSPAPATVTETVDFSEPMSTSYIDVSLAGTYLGGNYSATSEIWQSGPNGPDSELVLTYSNLPNDTYTLNLYAGGFQDLVGNSLQNTYTANFAVAFGVGAFPTLTPVNPLGSLIYQGDASHVLVNGADYDVFTIALNPGQTLSIKASPQSSGLQPDILLWDPNGSLIGQAVYNATTGYSLVNGASISIAGTYSIYVYDNGWPAGATGLYNIHLDLNALIKPDNSVDTVGGALNLDSSAYTLGYTGAASRDAVVGTLYGGPAVGDVYVSSRYYGYYNQAPATSDILRLNSTGQIVQVIPIAYDPYLSVSGVELDPVNNMLYAAVTTSFNGYGGPGSGSVDGELLEFDPITGQQVAAINLPVDNANNFWYYPYGFSIAPDGTFWLSQPNSQNIIRIDASGNLLASYSTAGMVPESASIGADGNVYFTGVNGPDGTAIYQLNTGSGSVNCFAFSPAANLTTTAPGGSGIWTGDTNSAALQYDYSGNLQRQVGFYGAEQAQNDQYGGVWTTNTYYWDVFHFDQFNNYQFGTFVPLPIGVTVWGVDNSSQAPIDSQDYYSFTLAPGQEATIVGTSLNGDNLQVTLLASDGSTVLATGVAGASNVTSTIANFLDSGAGGTYYVEITGAAGVQYSLVVTKDSTFSLQPHNSQDTAQPIVVDSTSGGHGGALGYLASGGGVTRGAGFAGENGASQGVYPPDTNAAVSPNYVVETVNDEFVVFDKNGSNLFSETLNNFFALTGHTSAGDVYVVWDPLAQRWYVDSISATNNADLLFAVSNDANPLDGFSHQYVIPSAASGDLADFPKFGYNANFITFSANDFGDGHSEITVINKADAIAGTLTYVQLTPSFNFRALVPAQDSTDTGSDPIWFVSSPYLNQGATNNVIRVTKLTDPFGSATFTDNYVPVDTYGGYASMVDQPGGAGTVAANDNTATQVFEYNGTLVTAFPASTSADGYYYPKVHYYTIDVSSGTPNLTLQGVVDPGPGVATFFPTATMNPTTGDLGLTWMESSSSEYVSMWVGTVSGSTHALSTYDAAPGATTEFASGRNGDYSTVVYDSSTDSFWAANEYAGADNGNVIWDTWIQQFSAAATGQHDWYSVNVQNAASLELITTTPGDAGFGQFDNSSMSLVLNVYDASGNFLGTGTPYGDGRNEYLIQFQGSYSGQIFVQVTNSSGAGEYFLDAYTKPYVATSVSGDVFNDLYGNGTDYGYHLNGWTVELLDSQGHLITTQVTHTINGVDGSYDFAGLAPGQYNVEELVQLGWTATTPAEVAVDTTSGSVSGVSFGDFQLMTFSGTIYNDLTGSGSVQPGDPGLAGWTVELVDLSTDTVASFATTDANGNYTFTNVPAAPANYGIFQEVQGGWIATPFYYYWYVPTYSGANYTGLNFTDFQTVTYAGTVYNDAIGNGALDGGDSGLGGWTVNLYSGSTLIATAITAPNGSYSFSGLGPGSYTIQEVTPSGWIITQPGSPTSYSETAISGGSETSLNFGNFKLASFSGNVFNDLNGNGIQDKGDVGLGGWVVELLNASGNVVASAVTGKTGTYSFSGIYPGTFTVEEIVKSGWYQTTPPTVYVVQSTSGGMVSGLAFGDKVGVAPAAPAAGAAGGSVSIVPSITTDVSVPSASLKTGSSAVVVSQPAASTAVPITANLASVDEVYTQIGAVAAEAKNLSDEEIMALLAKNVLSAQRPLEAS